MSRSDRPTTKKGGINYASSAIHVQRVQRNPHPDPPPCHQPDRQFQRGCYRRPLRRQIPVHRRLAWRAQCRRHRHLSLRLRRLRQQRVAQPVELRICVADPHINPRSQTFHFLDIFFSRVVKHIFLLFQSFELSPHLETFAQTSART